MYENYIFEGGSYRHGELVELIVDLGGYIITERIFAQEATITFTAPVEEYEVIESVAADIQGMLRKAPLLGTEIAVVTPTITRHHLPHPVCDMAEIMRRKGAQTNVIGLARGVGRRIAQLTLRERQIIEEHDVCLIGFGNFKRCIAEKVEVFKTLNVPVVAVGLPEIAMDGVRYVSMLGRLPYTFKRLNEIELLKKISDEVEEAVKVRKVEIAIDPPFVPPWIVKDELLNQVEDIKHSLAPAPIVQRLNGVRIKIPYDDYHEVVENVLISDYRLSEIATITKSSNRGRIIVELTPMSLLNM
jgi:putative methanogenesis marker protein 7